MKVEKQVSINEIKVAVFFLKTRAILSHNFCLQILTRDIEKSKVKYKALAEIPFFIEIILPI